MAFSMSLIQPFRDLIFTSAIFISILALTASSTPVSPPSFEKLVNTISPRNAISDYGNTTDTVLHIEPKTYKLTLPWWTQLVGVVGDFLMAFYTVTFAWEKRGSGKPRAGLIKVIHKFASKSYLFVQTFAGFVHLAINSGRDDGWSIVQRPGGKDFVALFLGACDLWNKTNLENRRTLLPLAWANCLLALVLLVIFSLPVISSGPVFQAWAPGCSYVLNSGNGTTGSGPYNTATCSTFWGNGLEQPFTFNQSIASQFTCATEYELSLGRNGMESQRIMSYFSWFYVFVIVLLLIGTAIVQIRTPIQDDEYRAVPLVALAYGGIWVGITYMIQSQAFNAAVVVCPDIANSTSGLQTLNNATCTCVDIHRQLILPIKTVLEGDSSALSRLISNF
ncbi:hypothetical protein N431DRAFT_445288 [Stipitochalara longipes BDJ]|nr:hypothetical protein N431DRAFT_445288 [Stipitochalara longipes BDJ]